MTTMESVLNQTGNDTSSSQMTSPITPMTIAAVSVVMVISTVAVFMNSGILLMTYALKLISKDYRMVYYVLITATDLAFSVHSVINCATIIFREIEFFKFKWFCLILQCSGVASYQISAMSIILLVSDLFVSIRNPFITETNFRRKVSFLACFIAIFISCSLAYAPFVWWFGTETKLEFCSIANLYGPYFIDYHKMATSVLAVLFFLMIVTSFLLLREIKISIQPRRPKSLKIPAIFKDDCEERSERKLKTDDDDDENHDNDMIHGKPTDESKLPDVVSDVEKVTVSLSSYVGIDNKAFDKEERMSIRNKLLNIDNQRTVAESSSFDEQEEVKPKGTDAYTEAYMLEAGVKQHSADLSPRTTNRCNGKTVVTEQNEVVLEGTIGQVNYAYDDKSEKEDMSSEDNGKERPVCMHPEAPTPSRESEDKQRLSVDNDTPYRGSIDKVRRLTGTSTVGPAMKEIAAAQSENRKKFMRACTTVAAFMTAYLGCGLPYYILSVIELSQGTAEVDSVGRRTVRMICALFLYLLPIVDPILYTSRFQIIRQTLCRFLPKCCKCMRES